MQKQDKWRAIIDPVIAGTPFELVGVECVGGGKHMVVRVYIDKVGGITIEEITDLSKQISVIFDVEDPINGLYTLEVSSPGLDRPLLQPEHFQHQIGKVVSLKARPQETLEGNRHNFKGTLLSADDKEVKIDVEGQIFTFAYDDIERAKVVFIPTASDLQGNSKLRQDNESK